MMGTALCFAAFLAAMLWCVIRGMSTLWALGIGLAAFGLLGLSRGCSLRQMAGFAWDEGRKLNKLLLIFALIGMLTGLWRSGGTIAWCIYYGTQVIRPRIFLLVAFLLTCLLSYALGTSFGVCGTAGIILMALGRSGGVDVPLVAGTVLAGAYFGDRCSPVSSSALLTAALTETKLMDSLKTVHATALLPMALSAAAYALLSWRHPLREMDAALLTALNESFSLTLWAVLPAVLMIVLPLCRLSVNKAFLASITAAFLITVLGQRLPLGEALLTALRGYRAPVGPLQEILSGGGVTSMLSAGITVLATSMLAGLLSGLHIFDALRGRLETMAGRIGLYPTLLLSSAAVAGVFCNQTIAIVMGASFMKDSYDRRGRSRNELSVDVKNSAAIVAPLIPWNIAGAIPLAMMGSDVRAIPYAALLYLIPLCYLFTKRWFYPTKEVGMK